MARPLKTRKWFIILASILALVVGATLGGAIAAPMLSVAKAVVFGPEPGDWLLFVGLLLVAARVAELQVVLKNRRTDP